VGEREDRLDAHGGEQRVADAMRGDQGSHVLAQPGDGLAEKTRIPVEQGECALLPG
jgi:hypothetical protein